MALHKDFLKDKFAILEPGIYWFQADGALSEHRYEKLLPPRLCVNFNEINSIEINSPKYANILKQEFIMSRSNRDNNLRTIRVHLDKTITDSGMNKK